jgi:hypothetical protein
MTRERLIRIGNNTLIALERQPQPFLGDVLARLRRTIAEMGFDEAARESEQNFGMNKMQMTRWEHAACRELGVKSAVDVAMERVR